MPIYQFTARDDNGQLVSDRAVFRDEVTLRHHLRSNNLFLLNLEERRQSGLRFNRNVGLGDLIIMSRQLRTMVMAGMPLVAGLEALAEQSTNPRLGELMREVARSVTTGRSLASSLGDHPRVFPELMVTLIHSGEIGGRLPEALTEASRQLELQMDIRQKLVSALIYPVFTLFATFCVVTAMMIWIVPVFAKIYTDLHAVLPVPTLMLIALSDLITHDFWIPLLIVAAAGIALYRYDRTPDGRLKLDRIKLNIPLLGNLIRKAGSASITGTLAGLLDSGVPLIQAMNTCARVCGNTVLAQAMNRAALNVETGRRLSDELEATEQFQLMVVRMIGIGEETGNLPEVLRHISANYIEEVNYAIKRVMSVIEPILILFVGGIVGCVLVALYYPLFNLGNVFAAGA